MRNTEKLEKIEISRQKHSRAHKISHNHAKSISLLRSIYIYIYDYAGNYLLISPLIEWITKKYEENCVWHKWMKSEQIDMNNTILYVISITVNAEGKLTP